MYNFDRLDYLTGFLLLTGEFKCRSCFVSKKEKCGDDEEVCEQENPICLTTTAFGYVIECATMELYKKTKEDCDIFHCDVSYCTESMCNA